jgi:hypothetical protein
MDYDIEDIIAAADRCFHALNTMLTKRYIRARKYEHTKLSLRPIILYDSEIWMLTGKMASTLTT